MRNTTKVQHDKSAIMKRVQAMKKVQFIKKVEHEESITLKDCIVKKV